MKGTNDRDDSAPRWECPFCSHTGATIIDQAVMQDDWKEILCECFKCKEMYIRKYKFVKTIKLIRQEIAHRE